jgi:hypothetical protein
MRSLFALVYPIALEKASEGWRQQEDVKLVGAIAHALLLPATLLLR